MLSSKAARIAILISVAVVCIAALGMAQNWLNGSVIPFKGYQYGAKAVTIPVGVADLEYGRTLKLRIDADRDKVSAEKLSNNVFNPIRVAGDTWYVGTQSTTSVIIKTPEGNIILNYPWGNADVSKAVIASMEKAGLLLKDIKIYLSSENHGDHNGGVAEMIAKTHAKLITMEGDVEGMENQNPTAYPQPKVDQIIKDGFVLKFGGKTLTANHTKGHTLGSTTWIWQEKENGATYNVAVPCCWSMSGNLVTNPDIPTERYKQTWQRLKSLPIDIPLGHHPWQFLWLPKQARLAAGEDKMSVFVDPAGYRGWTAVYEELFQTTLATQLKEGPPAPRGQQPPRAPGDTQPPAGRRGTPTP